MIKLYDTGVYLIDGTEVIPDKDQAQERLLQRVGRQVAKDAARQGTIAHQILESHAQSSDGDRLSLCFDALASHDITHVSIIQAARAVGLEKFAVPYILTNCHNSLSAVGGTINEDDHDFALSAAKKYGGIYVPPHLAVIHQYMREVVAGGGMMILGSDSHTRYGALGTLGIGEGGGELVKQIIGKTYDIERPEVVAVYLSGKVEQGVGPQDVALAIIGAVFKNGYVKDKIMEFVGDGIAGLSVEFRHGIDVMTTEATSLSSVWCTDEKVKQYLFAHGRADAHKYLAPARIAYYDGLIHVDLAAIRPMIALPFHPSNTFTIADFKANTEDILHKLAQEATTLFGSGRGQLGFSRHVREGRFHVDQAIVAGCAGGTYENISAVADILEGQTTGRGSFSLCVYPSSQPMYISLVKSGIAEKLLNAGVVLRTAFCGPCFGAGDVPASHSFSIRHTTRNFIHREGSIPSEGQIAYVALMDSRSIAATAVNGGSLTAATELELEYSRPDYRFSPDVYEKRVYKGFGKPVPQEELRMAPSITDWPPIPELTEHLLLKVITVLPDQVITTDDLIPSGEISSFRSNPLRLAEFTLSRKDPMYVGRAKEVHALERIRQSGLDPCAHSSELSAVFAKLRSIVGIGSWHAKTVGLGSTIVARKIGDGSAREQAASSQRVLGGSANIACEYATRRYRANLINWGILPFVLDDAPALICSSYIFVPNIRQAIETHRNEMTAYVVGGDVQEIRLALGELAANERQILLAGSLINHYRSK
ncbi:MAG: hydratase [Firmicutes bacterium]|nr:hydratase [Dethiobacter sp.]MBS3889770.1 hydratase [Bacillota bacterium]MBS4054897.1 hydratase [Thermaerobacter sp.]